MIRLRAGLKWLNGLLPKRLTTMPTPELPDPAWDSLQKVLTNAEAGAKARIRTVMLSSAALRIALDLNHLHIVALGMAENKDQTVSVHLGHHTDVGLLLWALGASGTFLRIHPREMVVDRLVYDVDFQSQSMVMSLHVHPGTRLTNQLTMSDETP